MRAARVATAPPAASKPCVVCLSELRLYGMRAVAVLRSQCHGPMRECAAEGARVGSRAIWAPHALRLCFEAPPAPLSLLQSTGCSRGALTAIQGQCVACATHPPCLYSVPPTHACLYSASLFNATHPPCQNSVCAERHPSCLYSVHTDSGRQPTRALAPQCPPHFVSQAVGNWSQAQARQHRPCKLGRASFDYKITSTLTPNLCGLPGCSLQEPPPPSMCVPAPLVLHLTQA